MDVWSWFDNDTRVREVNVRIEMSRDRIEVKCSGCGAGDDDVGDFDDVANQSRLGPELKTDLFTLVWRNFFERNPHVASFFVVGDGGAGGKHRVSSFDAWRNRDVNGNVFVGQSTVINDVELHAEVLIVGFDCVDFWFWYGESCGELHIDVALRDFISSP